MLIRVLSMHQHSGWSKMSTQDLGPRTRHLGPRTHNLGPKTPGPGTRDPKTWDPRILNFFIELQSKLFKSKKSLASKRDNAKHAFTYFYFHIFLSS